MCTDERLEVWLGSVLIFSCVALFILLRRESMALRTFRMEGRWLGVIVQLHADEGGWFWVVPSRTDLTCGTDRFPTHLAAMIMAMTVIFEDAVSDELSAGDPDLGSAPTVQRPFGTPPVKQPPPHGSGGGC